MLAACTSIHLQSLEKVCRDLRERACSGAIKEKVHTHKSGYKKNDWLFVGIIMLLMFGTAVPTMLWGDVT